jgi:hypothetical protein
MWLPDSGAIASRWNSSSEPSRDHSGEESWWGPEVTRRSPLPSGSMVQMSPSRVKAILPLSPG